MDETMDEMIPIDLTLQQLEALNCLLRHLVKGNIFEVSDRLKLSHDEVNRRINRVRETVYLAYVAHAK